MSAFPHASTANTSRVVGKLLRTVDPTPRPVEMTDKRGVAQSESAAGEISLPEDRAEDIVSLTVAPKYTTSTVRSPTLEVIFTNAREPGGGGALPATSN